MTRFDEAVRIAEMLRSGEASAADSDVDLLADALLALAREAEALRQRCEDAELIVTCDVLSTACVAWAPDHKLGGWVLCIGPKSFVVMPDARGFPILTPESRTALRAAQAEKR